MKKGLLKQFFCEEEEHSSYKQLGFSTIAKGKNSSDDAVSISALTESGTRSATMHHISHSLKIKKLSS